jgi:UDP-N-acetylmuramate dehydrogenase
MTVATTEIGARSKPLRISNVLKRIKRNEPLAQHTSLRIGGLADYFAEPRSIEEIQTLVAFAEENGLPWLVLGNGTNVLFPDEGYRGLIIHLSRAFGAKRLKGDRLLVQSGAGLGATMGYVRAHGFYDFDGLVGIPGTIGGALAMNAGIPEFTLSEIVRSVIVLTEKGKILTLAKEQCEFGYRTSVFLGRPWVILAGEFQLGGPKRFDPRALLARRRGRQPLGQSSPGCVFRNPLPSPPTAGQLLERASLKGLRCGGAMISPIHANFFVNCGGATASDVLRLIDIAREKVYKEFNVELQLELVVVSNARLR